MPAALLALLVEHQARDDLRAARATVDILGPVPMAPARVHTTRVRQGRNTEYWTAGLEIDDLEVLRIAVWRIAPAPALPASTHTRPPHLVDRPAPETLPDYDLPRLFRPDGFVPAVQWRFARGGLDVPGPGAAWTRLRHPLLEGVPTPAISRLILAAAVANGVGGILDPREYLTIDVDITVHLEREIVGDWLCTDAVTHVREGVTGRTEADFHDRAGAVGHASQTLLVAPRTAPRASTSTPPRDRHRPDPQRCRREPRQTR